MNIATTVIKSRHSVRKFKSEPISEDAIKDAILAGCSAPSAMNLQPWLIGVVKDKGKLKIIADFAENGRFISDSAACFVVFGKKKETYYLEDCCAVTENIIISLQAYGIGTCWVAGDKKGYAEDIRKLLAVPAEYTLVSMVPAGIPAEISIAKKKNIESLTFFESYPNEK